MDWVLCVSLVIVMLFCGGWWWWGGVSGCDWLFNVWFGVMCVINKLLVIWLCIDLIIVFC